MFFVNNHPCCWTALRHKYTGERPFPWELMVDAQTGETVELKSKHDLFFIPMEYWGPIIALVGVLSVL